ncbi:MAG: hypothetical protein NTU61_04120, partial [Candidatus Altiarchaeota archaeon]|nr:hypothetical protein [Candidatus Altiarchaeota archaeon]
MTTLSDIMISKLNVDETQHPKGASILIGLEGQGKSLADVFLQKLAKAGLTVTEKSTYPIGPGETPALLLFIRRASGLPPQ